MAIDFTKHISNLVASQFPGFYQEEGEMFITFVKAYYEWMETEGQVLYGARRLSEYRDIDTTVEEFILRFKNKYLANIQFNVATNKQLFIKNALEFYRAKGSERAVDLFFKLVYGLEARVYYPGDDLFKLSDNTWENERYLEIIPNAKNLDFVGQQVFGSISGATAFVERLVRVKKGSQMIEVLYLSGLNGDFQTSENVVTRNLNEKNVISRINGSLSSFEILTSSGGFEIGELVYVSDGRGKKAKAFVKQTTDYVGIVEFTLIDGGWGYSNQAEVIGSERSFRFDNITFEDLDYFYHVTPEQQFQRLVQDLTLVDLDPNSAETENVLDLDIGTNVYAYTNNDPVTNPIPVFNGKIVEKNTTANTIVLNYTESDFTVEANGNIILDAVNNINLFGNTVTSFWTSSDPAGTGGANTVQEVVVQSTDPTAITNVKAEANVIAWGDTLTMEYTGAQLFQGEVLHQHEDIAKARYNYLSVANTFSIVDETGQRKYANVKRTLGFPRTNRTLHRESDGEEFTIVDVSNVEAGVISYNNDLVNQTLFKDFANTYGSNTGFYSSKNDSFTYTQPAIFQIDERNELQGLNGFTSGEVINTEADQIIHGGAAAANLTVAIDYVNENGLGSVDFANTTLADALTINTNQQVEYGTIQAIVTTAQGREYSRDPFFVIYDPDLYHFERYDFYIRYKLEDQLKAFRIGENIITLNGSPESKARIFEHNPTTGEIKARRIKVSDYDDVRNITNITGNSANGTVTVTTSTKHTIEDGDIINIVNTTNFNGTGIVASKPFEDEFTFTYVSTNANPDETSGTVTGNIEDHVWLSDDFKHGDTITGENSDISADIEVVDELRMFPRSGLNADVNARAFSGVGFATDLEIFDSGYGYFGKRYAAGVLTEQANRPAIPGETLNLISQINSDRTIQAYGFLGKQGVAPGTHPNRKSFLSEDKYLADNDFYQEYSYQVLTALPFDKYKQTLVDVLHVAGSKPFGGYVGTSEAKLELKIESSAEEYIIKQFPMFINDQSFFTHTAS